MTKKDSRTCFRPLRSRLLGGLSAALLCAAACHSTPDSQERLNHFASLAQLTASEAAECTELYTRMWQDAQRQSLQEAFDLSCIRLDGRAMQFWWTAYGEAPADGHSLYISLHGGGGAPAELNDQQWDNQKQLYQPDEGIYLCPRAIDNTWDLHFLPGTDAFYETLIRMAQVFLGVNPNRVYLMGYSAGGDGVWRLAPRMADHWAAASMMAGHPGDVGLENLRNTPFMIWCGAEDAAYDRNLECQKRIDEMAALHAADPEGYDFEGHILSGKGHWMDREDAAAVPWMALRTRQPYPDRIVWKQEEGLRSDFYWLSVPEDECERGKTLVLRRSGNDVRIERCDYQALTLHFSDAFVDLDAPIRVYDPQGRLLFSGILPRKAELIRENLERRGDPHYAFPARLELKF